MPHSQDTADVPVRRAFVDWLQREGWRASAYAKRLGVQPSTVGKWALPPDDPKHQKPKGHLMMRIYSDSGGQVDANSFFGIGIGQPVVFDRRSSLLSEKECDEYGRNSSGAIIEA